MKNMIKYLAIFTIAISFCTGAVSASQLVEHDFGHFNALVPENIQFDEEHGMGYSIYSNESNRMAYFWVSDFGGMDMSKIFDLISSVGFEKVNTTGNLTVFKINGGDIGQYGVGIDADGEFVCITSSDLNQLIKIGESVKFN